MVRYINWMARRRGSLSLRVWRSGSSLPSARPTPLRTSKQRLSSKELLYLMTRNSGAPWVACMCLSVLDIDPSQDDMTRLFTKILWERTASAKDLNALLTGMPSLAEE